MAMGPIYRRSGPKLRDMAGLYVHIPFCAQACTYCDFHFTTALGDRDRMAEALLTELRAALPDWSETPFSTLYFGGGTPSVMSPSALARFADVLRENGLWAVQEWTVEANPEDMTEAVLDALLEAGVQRLSIGVQSFQADVLTWMKRIHGVDKAERAVRLAAERGFEHLSLDLIYGVPVGGPDRWERDLDIALDLPVDHLSAYILTAEPKTLYGHQLDQGHLSPPPDDQVLAEYTTLCDRTRSAGFEHYEVSNFARPGGRSQHNSAYWNGTPYLGIGPGAHSHRGHERWWNGRSNARYMDLAEAGNLEPQRGREHLTREDRFNEALMTGLRRLEGVDPDALLAQTGLDVRSAPALPGLLDSGRCAWREGRLAVPEQHWPAGDAITLELMP